METQGKKESEESSAAKILGLSGYSIDPETAAEIWPAIQQHKWYLSEKLGRDVGLKIACLDYIENMNTAKLQQVDRKKLKVIREMNGQIIDADIWNSIADSQPPKQIVEKRIILPLVERELAEKHGVIPPKTIIFFGPPGTGKTHFVKAMAGVLKWWYIEISPSDLMAEGEDRLGANLKKVMEKARSLNEAVVFIDEFEEIAGSRDQASRMDKSITNEFLKQVPLFKRQAERVLLVCATNYIHQLDAALLRPGRFDCIIPVGELDESTRKTIFQNYLNNTNHGQVNVEEIISMIPLFTPADIEFLFQKVSQLAFEKEYIAGSDFRVTTETFKEVIPQIRPTLTEELIKKFQEACITYCRY